MPIQCSLVSILLWLIRSGLTSKLYFYLLNSRSLLITFLACPIGGDDDPYPLCMRGFDNSVYYMVDKTQYVQLLNYSGCGNTVSGNHPVTQQMIVDCLRWYYPASPFSSFVEILICQKFT